MTCAKEIIEELNLLRQDPKAYSEKLVKYKSYFKGKTISFPGSRMSYQTNEGYEPYIETIEFLKNQAPRRLLTGSKALCEISFDLVEKIKQSETGELEDEDEVQEIIDKHGSFNGNFNKSTDLGGLIAEQVIINLLVCDGDTDRNQREYILNKGARKVGAAYGKNNDFHTCSVICLASDFENSSDKEDIPTYELTKDEIALMKELEIIRKLEEERKKELEDSKKEKERRKEWEKNEKERKMKEMARLEEEKKEKERLELERKKQEEELRKQEEIRMRKQKRFFQIVCNMPGDDMEEGIFAVSKYSQIVKKGDEKYKIVTTIRIEDGCTRTEKQTIYI